jgi:(R)-2-hydroxyacyl-CoA dehydratese activating ATPase
MICAGIDAGSRALKIVLLDTDQEQVIASAVTDQGVAQEQLASELLERLLASQHLARDQVARIVATGYGRSILTFADTTITEITCHAVGTRHLVPDARMVIDIGGQDSKVIRLNPEGIVRDFMMNDRCAAGTGRFLEVVAEKLHIALEALGQLAARSASPAIISSMCVVFAETEIIGLLASGAKPEDIVAGVQASLTQRVAAMAGRHVETPIVFTGGVALIPGMDNALSTALGHPVTIAPQPRFTGALGAALLAARQCSDASTRKPA